MNSVVVKYRVVKWSPLFPARHSQAEDTLFDDYDSAVRLKNQLQDSAPYRCYAVQPVIAENDQQI
jgi:hypothetical protein